MMGGRSAVSMVLCWILAAHLTHLRAGELPGQPAESKASSIEADAGRAMGEVDDLPQWPRLVVEDTKAVLRAPAVWDGKQWRGFAIAVGAVIGTGITLDHPVREAFQRNRSESRDRWANSFEKLGSTYAFAAMGGAYLYGWAGHDGEAKATGTDAFMASVITGVLLRPALKYTIGRARPDEGAGTHAFKPFGGGDSFPSGHTMEAFTVASVFAAHYPSPWVQITAYGLASLAGLARLEQDGHFASDVVAGAILGTVVGRAVTRFNRIQRSDTTVHDRFVWAPVLTADYRSIRLSLIY